MALRIPSIDLLPPPHRAAAMRQLHPRTITPAKPRKDTEHTEQVVFFNRIRTLAMNDPRYAMAVKRTHAVPNGGGRSKREAGRLKAEGVTPGVSDIFCALPSGAFHGLYIEMKSLTGLPSREQKAWLADSVDLGYTAACCRGADEAIAVWMAYVAGVIA